MKSARRNQVGTKVGCQWSVPTRGSLRLTRLSENEELERQSADKYRFPRSDTVLAGGMENMSQAPHVIRGARKGLRLGQGTMEDSLMVALLDSYSGLYMAQTSDNLARKYNISREEQDWFALRSQQKASAARSACRLSEEIVPVTVGKNQVKEDDHLRPDSTIEGLAKLKPAFAKDGFVTAGNASGIVDGAAIVTVTTAENAKGRKPLGRIVSWGVTGCDPDIMGIGPVPSTKIALKKAGLKLDDIDLIEVNEAFAGQILAVIKELGIDPEKLNVNGGAIALGHPLAASGTRLVLTLLHELRRRQRPGDHITLDLITAKRLEALPGGVVLDALGDHRQVEVVSQTDRRANNRGVLRTEGHAHHEGPVDFELIQRQPHQIRQ